MLVLDTIRKAQEVLGQLKGKETIALVPTMGCLHEGHLELVRLAQKHSQKVVVSIFVNPLQFGANEDFDKYPRTLESDVEKLKSVGVQYLFYPNVHDLYPDGFSNQVQVGELGNRLCGRFRPGHFNGVATVCLKLFEICRADLAVFGEKDFQQLQVIRNLVRDFNLPLSILSCPTIRENDGLAMSSRNRYLSQKERELAGVVPKTLRRLRDELGTYPSATVYDLLATARKSLSGIEVQYAEITEGANLKTAAEEALISDLTSPRFFLAVKIGNTRLIDNMSLKELR
ncbi:MAG: pantoate--beta-alanine ligase [Proteobacteria bacterium]|nr:pantoate--beta-alanine ligase [Pseudomonadota bacterium]